VEVYLDDCSDADRLVALLVAAGHRVETPRTAHLLGGRDHEHLAYAAQHGLTLITHNPGDFRELHDAWQAQTRAHGGILLVYRDNIRSKDMQPSDIVRALGNLIRSGLPIANEVHTLNHWR
jgi:hypothetical protein